MSQLIGETHRRFLLYGSGELQTQLWSQNKTGAGLAFTSIKQKETHDTNGRALTYRTRWLSTALPFHCVWNWKPPNSSLVITRRLLTERKTKVERNICFAVPKTKRIPLVLLLSEAIFHKTLEMSISSLMMSTRCLDYVSRELLAGAILRIPDVLGTPARYYR